MDGSDFHEGARTKGFVMSGTHLNLKSFVDKGKEVSLVDGVQGSCIVLGGMSGKAEKAVGRKCVRDLQAA